MSSEANTWLVVVETLEEKCRAYQRRLVEAGICPNCGEQIAHAPVIQPGSGCTCGFDFHPFVGVRPLIGALYRRIIDLRYQPPPATLP